MEQCSSEQTAHYKQQVVCRVLSDNGLLGGRLVDLTGGFGVDFSFMARGFTQAVYVERQERLCEIARQNFRLLGLSQAEVVCADSTNYLRTMEPAEVVFLDPARRDSNGGRTYAIDDCTPNVLVLRDMLLAKARWVLVKLSPMLDWRKAVSDIGEKWVREVHIVSVAGECKELLFLVGLGDGIRLVCVNDDSVFEVEGANRSYKATYGTYGEDYHFLYEPNASIMKAGCFVEVAQAFGVEPLAQNSHLFVSDRLVEDFPGRVFLIDAVTTMNKRELKQHLQGIAQANITVRNFPLSVAELRKRLKISEGGNTYIFATTLADKSHVLLITRKRCTEPQSR
jgi:hypothetical protein